MGGGANPRLPLEAVEEAGQQLEAVQSSAGSVSGTPQSGKGAGSGPAPTNSRFSALIASEMSLWSSPFASQAARQRGSAVPRKSEPRWVTGSLMSKRPSSL